jgi:hypothetical protein
MGTDGRHSTINCQHPKPSLGFSNVEFRANALVDHSRLLHATACKTRGNDLSAGGLSLQIGFYDHFAFACNVRIEPCHDPYTRPEHLIAVWPRVPAYTPSDLSVALTRLDLARPRTSSALIRLACWGSTLTNRWTAHYFPMQNLLKMRLRMSSLVVVPVRVSRA